MTKQEKSAMMISLANRWRDSGVAQEDFARENDITVHTLRYWLYKRKEMKQESGGFLQLSSLTMGNEYMLRYPNGIELKLPVQTPVAIIKSLIAL
ncbi:MAG: hypothetical protein EP310_00880 [Bacteroidetes bacterium]|nr:MAG: hypothetical protein EP310_00880 [Bacteroidota bacterium]